MGKVNENEQGAQGVQEQGAAAPAATTTTAVTALRLSEKFNVLGSIVNVSERKADKVAGGKFERDTKIVTLSDISTQQTVDVFITDNQWKEYNCAQHVYLGNVVNVTLEKNIEGVTGFYETSDSTELTPHTKTFNSFNRVVYVDNINLMTTLSKAGVDATVIGMIAQSVMQQRALHERDQQAKALSAMPGFSGFGANL